MRVTVDSFYIVNLAPSTILGLVVLMVYTGRLIPRRTYDDLLDDRNKWREACQMQGKQLDAVMEVGETVEVIMRAVEANARGRSL